MANQAAEEMFSVSMPDPEKVSDKKNWFRAVASLTKRAYHSTAKAVKEAPAMCRELSKAAVQIVKRAPKTIKKGAVYAYNNPGEVLKSGALLARESVAHFWEHKTEFLAGSLAGALVRNGTKAILINYFLAGAATTLPLLVVGSLAGGLAGMATRVAKNAIANIGVEKDKRISLKQGLLTSFVVGLGGGFLSSYFMEHCGWGEAARKKVSSLCRHLFFVDQASAEDLPKAYMGVASKGVIDVGAAHDHALDAAYPAEMKLDVNHGDFKLLVKGQIIPLDGDDPYDPRDVQAIIIPGLAPSVPAPESIVPDPEVLAERAITNHLHTSYPGLVRAALNPQMDMGEMERAVAAAANAALAQSDSLAMGVSHVQMAAGVGGMIVDSTPSPSVSMNHAVSIQHGPSMRQFLASIPDSPFKKLEGLVAEGKLSEGRLAGLSLVYNELNPGAKRSLARLVNLAVSEQDPSRKSAHLMKISKVLARAKYHEAAETIKLASGSSVPGTHGTGAAIHTAGASHENLPGVRRAKFRQDVSARFAKAKATWNRWLYNRNSTRAEDVAARRALREMDRCVASAPKLRAQMPTV